MYTDLDVRMKKYEQVSNYYLNDSIPIIIRLDGRAFHNFTKDLEKPYCTSFHDLMITTTCHLIQETTAHYGYTQSDEISLVLYKKHYTDQIYFSGRIQKIASILASIASVYFNKSLGDFLPNKVLECPVFDCRVFNIANDEVSNYFVWRQRDATRNSIQMAGQNKFTHEELMNKNTSQIQEMLWQNHQINWNDYPEFFKRGSLCKKEERRKYLSQHIIVKSKNEPFLEDELGKYVTRTFYDRVNTPIFKYDSECLKLEIKND